MDWIKRSKLLDLLILWILPVLFYMFAVFETQNLWTLIFIWPVCIITGIRVFWIGKKNYNRILLFLVYIVFYTLVLMIIYQFIYFKILGGGII